MRLVPEDNRVARKGYRGAVIVEFALMLPFLILLFLVIIDLGLVIHEHQVIQNAAREGARFSSLPRNQLGPNNPTASEAVIRQRVIDYCAAKNIEVSSEDIVIDQQFPLTVGELILRGSRVTLTYERRFLIPGGNLLPMDRLTLHGSAVFRNFY